MIIRQLKIHKRLQLNSILFYTNNKNYSKKVYSKTLNLPNAGNFKLSMKNVYEHEENIKRTCNFESLYKWQEESRRDNKNEYILHDGPPYANGDIHIGHMVNKVLKDVVLRYKLLNGYKVNYLPGWDCHGLPIELKATNENKIEKNTEQSEEARILQTRNIARNFALKYIKSQSASFSKLNLIADWSKIYRTIDSDYMCNELDLFYALYKKNLIFRDYMPVYWSTSSKTALAEFELEYNENHKSNAVYVKFDVTTNTRPNALNSLIKHDDTLSILIWTTTPWSLPGNKAIAFNPAIDYDLLNIGDNKQYYIIAHDLVDDLLQKIPKFVTNIKNFGKIDSKLLFECKYKSPFQDENVELKIIPSAHVNSKQGTGFVHIAPAFGFDDFQLAVKYDLKTSCVIDENGYYIKNDKNLENLKLNGKNALSDETIKRIEVILNDALIHKHEYTHSYPYDWRTKKPCIIRASPQWFINTGKLRDKALDVLSQVKIRPEAYSNSMVSSLNNKTYWCISRQRVWGLPIPCVFNEKNEIRIDNSLIDNIKNCIKKDGNPDFWWSTKYDKELFGNEVGQTKSKDILDIWFDSGSSFNSILKGNTKADLYCEGIDQFTGWFQSSLLLSIALNDQSPYKSILVHGFVVDENNHKMSKSLGNIIEPNETLLGNPKKQIPQLGNDSMRFFITNEYHKSQIQMGKINLKNTFERVYEMRSILRFLIANTCDLNNKTSLNVEYTQLQPIDKYILYKLYNLVNAISDFYEDLNLNKILLAIEKFLITDMSSFYIKSVKDRLYCELPLSLERQTAQYTLLKVLENCVFMLAPILPHLCEDAYMNSILKEKYKNEHLFYNIYKLKENLNENWNNNEINTVFNVINLMRQTFYSKIPSENETIFQINIKCTPDLYDFISKYFTDMNFLNDCFSYSQVKLDALNLNKASDITTVNIKQNGEDFFSLDIEKLIKNFPCARCRRHLNTVENSLCKRCDEVLKKL